MLTSESGQKSKVPKLKVPFGQGAEYSLFGDQLRKSMNVVPNSGGKGGAQDGDNFLISGGSIEKYLNKNTPKGARNSTNEEGLGLGSNGNSARQH